MRERHGDLEGCSLRGVRSRVLGLLLRRTKSDVMRLGATAPGQMHLEKSNGDMV